MDLKKLFNKTQKKVQDLSDKIKKLKKAPKEKVTFEDKITKLIKKIEHKEDKITVNLSPGSVAKATTVVLLLAFLAFFAYEIRSILLIFFISLLFSAALDPTIDILEKKKIPRGISVILIYIAILAVLAIFISLLIPLIATQVLELAGKVGELMKNLTRFIEKIDFPFVEKIRPLLKQFLESIDQKTLIDTATATLQQVGEQLQNIAGNAWNALKVVFHGIFNVILVLVLTFFMTIEDMGMEKFVVSLFPQRHRKYIFLKWGAIKKKVGYWLRGQLLLCLSIGVLTFIGLKILGIQYAATLAMIAGILELIPYLGPILAAIPALLIAANQSGWLVLWIAALYFTIQELENNVFVPIIMRKAVGLSPIITIFAMLVGAKFLGILGIILSVPVATIISIFVKDYASKAK